MARQIRLWTFCLVLVMFLIHAAWVDAQQLSNAPTPNATTDSQSGATSDNPTRSNTRSRSSSRDTYVRLARAPNMFGDSLRPTGKLVIRDTNNIPTTIEVLMGGSASFNAAENNRATPTDRAYFVYNGYYNAINFAAAGTKSLQNYTLGFEKTFFDGLWSIDVRMPFNSGLDYDSTLLSTSSGNVGNLSMFMKGLLLRDEDWAISSGLGLGLPTGSDVFIQTLNETVRIENDAVHLMPFLALTAAPNEWFLQAFTQIDFVASGNAVFEDQRNVGSYQDQHIFHADVAIGRWLLRELDQPLLYGVAGLVELHYASTIHDTDALNTAFTRQLTLSVPANRIDLLNLTSGLHFQLTPLSNFRVGAVAPLRSAPDRMFSSELFASFNRFF